MAKLGNQTPRIRTGNNYEYSAGEDVGYLAGRYGLEPDDWQQGVLDDWFAEHKNTKLIHTRVGLAVPRQNGKNAILEMVELYKMAVQGRKILHTAHEVKTARKAFLRIAGFFEDERNFPELAALVLQIRRTNGQESITLNNGGQVEFVARSRGSGRGFTVDDLVVDEAQDLTDEQLEALLPTISSAPSGDPQQLYTGTPLSPRSPGIVFSRIRNLGVAGTDRRLSWTEFSIPDETSPRDAVKNWRELAYETNPALGVRLQIGSVQDELKVMSADGFARERLGQWETYAKAAAISVTEWEQCCIDPVDAPLDGRIAFGIKFSADGSAVAIAGGIRTPDKRIHVEAIRWESTREGTRWLVDFLLERKSEIASVAIDGKYGTGMLVNELIEAGFPKLAIVTPRLEQVISAHSMMEQSITNHELSSIKQDEVMKQVEAATKRAIGKDGGFGWATRDEGGSVILLDALTLAHWMAKTTKRDPKRKAVAF